MKVTITLGQKAMEYVTGIPEDELPEILSDVVERSLAQQVTDVSKVTNNNQTIDSDFISELKTLVAELKTSTASYGVGSAEVSSLQRKKEMVVKKIEASDDTAASGIKGDLLELLK